MRMRYAKKIVYAAVVTAGIVLLPMASLAKDKGAAPASPPKKSTIAKLCTNCHEAEANNLLGNFENVAYKTQSIQIKIDDSTEILKFDKATLKVLNVKPDPEKPDEPLRQIKKGRDVRVEYTEKDGVKYATLVSAKPPVKVPPEQLVSTEEMEKYVAIGSAEGKYVLIDARPAPRFMEGAIPTAINIPFAEFEKNIDKLPEDKNILLIYYCGGVT